ncbi:glycosyl hydrolase family 43 protein [Aspergillus pseudodeflectus]|uniref:Glycosyl hydrolase family 43 protein n=1 Tax=Aspergillus pseudodeflectus TaxID=176178 RepID=A0ABR4K2E8_9EURO
MLAILLATALSTAFLVQAQTFTNPIIYEDFPDNDISRGPDGYFYFSASSFHYSPGAPILRSADLVNWELIAHSVPTLDFGPNYDLPSANETAYNLGTWASTLRYRESTEQWFWIGCANFWTTYVYTAPDVTGPWEQAASFQPCFYDCGLLVDDDDTLYVAYGSNNVSVAQLSADGRSVVTTQVVFSAPPECASIEGNRMYKINGTYYILDDCPSDGITEVWKADGPFGPYERRILVDSGSMASPVPGTGVPIQGSLVEVKETGGWYFMSFAWNYPLGRVPVLAPITWGEDGFPVLVTVDGSWGVSYPSPLPETEEEVPSWTGVDDFEGQVLGPTWQWNHNPDTTRFTLNDPGLTLHTATVTNDLYAARNTLTHRIHGAKPYGIVELEFSNIADGDHCGLAALKDASAWIGVVRNGTEYYLAVAHGLMMGQYGGTTSTGTIVATAPIAQTKVWLKVSMDAGAVGSHEARFSYSLDGTDFTELGGVYTLTTDYLFFMGYRYGIFNFATRALGGSVDVISFATEESS